APGPPAIRSGRTTSVAPGPSSPSGPHTVSGRPLCTTPSTTSPPARPSTTGNAAAPVPHARARAFAQTCSPSAEMQTIPAGAASKAATRTADPSFPADPDEGGKLPGLVLI